MKHTRRLISCILVVVLLLSSMPSYALTEIFETAGADATTDTGAQEAVNATVTSQENLSYKIRSEEFLTNNPVETAELTGGETDDGENEVPQIPGSMESDIPAESTDVTSLLENGETEGIPADAVDSEGADAAIVEKDQSNDSYTDSNYEIGYMALPASKHI